MKTNVVFWSGWIAFLTLAGSMVLLRCWTPDFSELASWLKENEKLSGWAGALATFFAVILVWAGSLWLFRHQQNRVAAEKMTSVYVIASAAGREIVLYDALQRGSAPTNHTFEERKKRIAARWDAWIVNRLTGLANLIEAYQATGTESGGFMQDLLTVQGRLRWLAAGAGRTVAQTSLAPSDAELLEGAAYDVVRSLLNMRAELDRIRKVANLPRLKLQKVETGPAGSFVASEAHRGKVWARASQI